MRSRYWCSSRLADWIRGTAKPKAASLEDWEAWEVAAKAAHPFRFRLAETALDAIQNAVYWPIDAWRAIRWYCRNRFIDKTHYLRTGLAPGCYHDFETRLLHGMFEALVDFVEKELASKQAAYAENRNFRGRSRALGMARLEWEASLKLDASCGVGEDDKEFGQPTNQAIAAVETRALYEWWKDTRPNRKDPYEEFSELSAREFAREHGAAAYQAERDFAKEDEAMMIRLVKLREGLWA